MGLLRIVSPLNENSSINVTNKAAIVIGVNTWRNFSRNHVSPLLAISHLREKKPATSGRAT